MSSGRLLSPPARRAALAGLIVILGAGTAHAGETGDEYQLVAHAGYGVSFQSGPNPYGLAVGGRLGYTFDAIPIYVGLQVYYFFGETLDPNPSKASYAAVGAEVGFDLSLSEWFVLRPSCGVGLGILDGGLTGGTVSAANQTSYGLYLSPGVTGLVPLWILLAGLDVRTIVAPLENQVSGITFTGVIGFAI